LFRLLHTSVAARPTVCFNHDFLLCEAGYLILFTGNLGDDGRRLHFTFDICQLHVASCFLVPIGDHHPCDDLTTRCLLQRGVNECRANSRQELPCVIVNRADTTLSGKMAASTGGGVATSFNSPCLVWKTIVRWRLDSSQLLRFLLGFLFYFRASLVQFPLFSF